MDLGSHSTLRIWNLLIIFWVLRLFSLPKVYLSQRKYSFDLLQDTGMLRCRPASTLMIPNLKISVKSGELLLDPSIYQQLVGQLIYLTNTRPDLTFAINVVS